MSLYKRPNSSYFWCEFVVGGRKIRRSTGTADREEAEEFETQLRSRHWRQNKLGESFHTFADAGKRWIKETEKVTVKKDQGIIDWFEPYIGDLPLREINREVLDAARGKLSQGLSKTTVNYYMGLVRSILRKAQSDWGWLEAVPKVPMFKRELSDPRFLTREQFKVLLSKLPAHSADLARFAVATGLRKANITGLTWDRVDLKRRTAFVAGSQAKAGKGIPVALNADAVALLKRLKAVRDALPEEDRGEYVFLYQGHRIQDVVTKAWRDACTKAGVPGFRFHDLRHTWASWQVQAETPLSVLQEMGGWASFEMVRRYAHLSPGHLRQYASATLLHTPRRRAKKKAA